MELFPSYDWLHHNHSENAAAEEVPADGTAVEAAAAAAHGNYDAFYDELLRQRTSENLCWFSPDAAELQKLFICDQPEQAIAFVF